MPPAGTQTSTVGSQTHQAKPAGSSATIAGSTDLKATAQQQNASSKSNQHSANQPSQPLQPKTTIQRLDEIATRANAKTGPINGTNSGPYKVYTDTNSAIKNSAIKVWYGADGKIEKYELFKLDAKGNPISSNFYTVKGGGELKVAKNFDDKNNPNGKQVTLQLKEIKEAHRELKAVGNEELTAFQRLSKVTPNDSTGYIEVNKATGFKVLDTKEGRRYELIDTQANKSYFFDSKGKLLFERALPSELNKNPPIKAASELSQEARDRLQKKLEAINNPKPKAASDSLFHTDGREISAETKKAAQAINGSMKHILRGGNDDATFFKTFEGLSDEKRQDLVDAYKKMYGVDLKEKVRQEFWGGIRRERAEALVAGEKITAKSAELQQKIEDSKFLWIFPDATKSRDAVGDVTRDLSPQEAAALREKHKAKYTDVNDQLGKAFSEKDKNAVNAYYAGKQVQGDAYSLAAENEKAATAEKFKTDEYSPPGRNTESVEKILTRHADRDQKQRDELNKEYKDIAGQDLKVEIKVGEYNKFRVDRNDALIDGNKNKATAIKLAEQKKDGFSANTIIETLDGVGKEKIKQIAIEYDQYVDKKEKGYGDTFRNDLIKVATTKDEITELTYLAENGELDDSMKLVRATTRIWGTDDEKIKEIIERNKADNLKGLDKKLKQYYGEGAGVDGIIASEVSQKSDLRFDYEEARKYGDPKTPDEQMAAVERRYQRENANRNWVVDKWWSKEDAQNFDESYKLSQIRYQEYSAAKQSGSNLETQRTASNLNSSYKAYLESENTYRVVREEAADSVASGAATVTAVAAGTVVTVASGGTLGPVVVGLLATGAGAVTSFGTRYAVRTLLEGDSYTWEEIGSDGASAALDGVGSAVGGKVAALATEKIALKLAQKEVKNVVKDLVIKGTNTAVDNAIQGGVSGAGTALSERRFWNESLSNSAAMLVNGTLLGATTGAVTGVATDLGLAGLGKLGKRRGGDDGGGNGGIDNGGTNNTPDEIDAVSSQMQLNSSNEAIHNPTTSLQGTLDPVNSSTTTVSSPTVSDGNQQTGTSAITESLVEDQVTQLSTPEQIIDNQYVATASENSSSGSSTPIGTNPISTARKPTSDVYSTQEIEINTATTGSLPEVAKTTSKLTSNSSSSSDGIPVHVFPREEVSDQFRRVSRTTGTLNIPGRDTSPLQTQNLQISKFKEFLFSIAKVIDSNVPGDPNGINETSSLLLYINSQDIEDSMLPYPAYAMKRKGNSFEELKETFDIDNSISKNKVEDFTELKNIEVSNITLTNDEHGGSAGIIKVGFLEGNKRPIVLKTYKNTDLNDQYFIDELKKNQLLSDLGIIKFHGYFVDQLGRPNIVTDIAPGGFSHRSPQGVKMHSLIELDDVLNRLEFAGVNNLGDFQYHITPNGHISLIDAGGLGLPGANVHAFANPKADFARQKAILLASADFEEGKKYLNYLRHSYPESFLSLKEQLKTLRQSENVVRYLEYLNAPQGLRLPDSAELFNQKTTLTTSSFIQNSQVKLSSTDRQSVYENKGRLSQSAKDPRVYYLQDEDFRKIAPHEGVASFYDKENAVIILRNRQVNTEFEKIKVREEYLHEKQHHLDRDSKLSSHEKERRAYNKSEEYLHKNGYEYYFDDQTGKLEVKIRKATGKIVPNNKITEDPRFNGYLAGNYSANTATLRPKIENIAVRDSAREGIFNQIFQIQNLNQDLIFDRFENLIDKTVSKQQFVVNLNSIVASKSAEDLKLIELLKASPSFKKLLNEEFASDLTPELKINFGVFETEVNLNNIPQRNGQRNGINERLKELGVSGSQRDNLIDNQPIAESYLQHVAAVLKVDQSSVKLTGLKVENFGVNTIYQQFVGDVEINGQRYTVRWHSALDNVAKRPSTRVIASFNTYPYELINVAGMNNTELVNLTSEGLLHYDGNNYWVRVNYVSPKAGSNINFIKTEVASDNVAIINLLNERRHIKNRIPSFLGN